MRVNEAGLYEGIVNGKTVVNPRVTSIIGEFLEDWDMVPARFLKKAADFGTAVHNATEYDDRGILKLHKLAVPLWPCLKAWRQFKKDFDVKFEAIEPVVYSMKYGFAGRADRIGTVRSLRSVIDIKTCKYKPLTHDLQVAAYQGGWNEMNPKSKVWRRYLVELKRDGTYRVTELKGAGDYAVFLGAVALYNWKRGRS